MMSCKEIQPWYDSRGPEKWRQRMLCRGLQAWYDKRQGTGYTVEMPQLCGLPPGSILEVPEAREAWWGGAWGCLTWSWQCKSNTCSPIVPQDETVSEHYHLGWSAVKALNLCMCVHRKGWRLLRSHKTTTPERKVAPITLLKLQGNCIVYPMVSKVMAWACGLDG